VIFGLGHDIGVLGALMRECFRPSTTTVVNYFNYFFHPRVVTTTKLIMPIRSSL
jgi:hypothetical protein